MFLNPISYLNEMTTVQKNDFIEIEFNGLANGEIFDTTNKEEAKKIGLDANVKPIIISVGNEMLLKGLDEDLERKEIGKKYSISLKPEGAFGKRNPFMIKTVPIRVFHEKQMNPYPGMSVQMDNYIAKILAVSGGRVSVDFNYPLAGKDITYNYTIKRIVKDDRDKINALQDFFFRQRFDFEIKDKKVIFKNPEINDFLEVFNEKFKEITGLEFEIEEAKEKKENLKINVEELMEGKEKN